MVRTLQLVSRSQIMKGDRDLGVVLRWLGGLGDKRAQRSRQSKSWGSLPLTRTEAAVARGRLFRIDKRKNSSASFVLYLPEES